MKEKCKNHPTILAKSFCHHCREHYCIDCLDEGKEYYYCHKPDCQRMLLSEAPSRITKNKIVTLTRGNDTYFLELATVGARLGAVFLDTVVLIIVNSLLAFVFQLEQIDARYLGEFWGIVWFSFWHPISLVTFFLYSTFTESSSLQSTLGKRIFGIIVITTRGDRLSLVVAAGRNLVKLITSPLAIGPLFMLFTQRRQSLYDLALETLVVRNSSEDISCPNCQTELQVEQLQKLTGEATCPECKKEFETKPLASTKIST